MEALDWLRAKSYLIAAFFLLDLFLGVSYWAQGQRPRPAAAQAAQTGVQQEQADVQAALQKAGVKLEGVLPAGGRALPYLKLQLEPVDETDLIQALFPDGRYTAIRWPGNEQLRMDEYDHGNELLYVWPFGIILYTRIGADTAGPLPDAATARRRAEAFAAARMGGLPTGAIYDFSAPIEASYGLPRRMAVYFSELYHGYPIWGSSGSSLSGPLRIDVTGREVVAFQQNWLKAEEDGSRRPTISPAEALLRLAGYLKASPTAVMRVAAVDLGYFASNPDWKEPWKVAPVWRVRLTDWRVFYVNAYTGALEGR